jgi:ubiquinone/menaquinone biosynthesis C-methylase UbiE
LSFEVLIRNRSAYEFADLVLPSIGSRDRILDVGCGPGSITVGLAQVAGHVTGIDVDAAEFADARAYAEEHGIDNVEFLEGSIFELDVPDASIDICTLFAMLETLDEPLTGLAEVRRVMPDLRPGACCRLPGRVVRRRTRRTRARRPGRDQRIGAGLDPLGRVA